jgi:hypothetical protein
MCAMKTMVGRRWAPVVTVPAMLLALGALSACGGDDDEPGGDETTSASDTESPGEGESTPPTTSPPDLPVPPQLGRAEGAVDDVEWDQAECGTEAGEQSVSGTITNSTDARTGYLVQISWTNNTSDVLGLGYELIRGARPGEETEWTIDADVADGATQCVIFVQRGVIKKG